MDMRLEKAFELALNGASDFLALYNGVFFDADGTIGFAYRGGYDLVEIIFVEKNGVVQEHITLTLPFVSTPRSWRIISENNNQVLLCPVNRLAADCYPRGYAFLIKGHSLSQADYYRYSGYCHGYSSVPASYEFGDYSIIHERQFKYSCYEKNNGKLIWTQVVQGYLYSDIARFKDVIVINTSGKGGYVYGISIVTGKIIYKIKTGETSAIAFSGGNLYTVIEGKNGTLIVADIQTGSILCSEEIFSADCFSSIGVIGEMVAVVTNRKNENGRPKPFIQCFAMPLGTVQTVESCQGDGSLDNIRSCVT